jgi:integrase
MKKLLESHRKWQQNLKAEMNEEWIENDRLFTTVYGTSIHPDTVTKVTVHGLRYTFISLLISKGID